MPPFLSDDWFDAVETARVEVGDFDAGVHARLNLVVTTAGDDVIAGHIDTTSGLAMGKGHVDGADVTLTLPVEIARTLLVEGDQQAGMQAFMTGQIKVDGDITKMLALQGALAAPEATRLREKVAAVTS